MELRVLGRIELSSHTRTVPIPASRQRGLLALLVLERGRSLSNDWLIDQLWDGAPPPAAKATLQSCVYRLRRIFAGLDGPVELQTRSGGYVLSLPPHALDLDRFEQAAAKGRQAVAAGRLAEAVAAFRSGLGLWRGEAFDGVDVATVREHADRLRERRLDVTEQCLEAELAGRRHAQVVDELADLTGQYPLRESLWRLRMLALARSGRKAEALDAYDELVRLLDEQLGLEPSAPVRRLHEQILAGDPAVAPPVATAPTGQTAPTGPAAPAARTIPRMLPAAIGDFTGRRTQLAGLDALLPLDGFERPGTVVISAISGTAGIGKTMLAVHWTHRIADRFPDGQLYVNLRGFHPTGQPVPPAEALRGFLAALGVPAERIPADLDARIGMYRSLLAERQVVVLLDNARDSEQARPLLPGAPGCLVVVTSRNRLGGLVGAEAARPVLLDLLTAQESRELLARRLGTDRTEAEPEAVDAIIRSCARLPLALAIAAARAATNPEFPLRVLAGELADAASGLDAFAGGDPAADVRAVLSWSYRQLSKPAARLFRQLGIHPGPDISVAAAASLAGVARAEVRSHLGELTRAHLLTQHQPGRYAFHDLLRAYAAELAAEEDSAADSELATRRMLDHYVHTAYDSADLLHSHRDRVSIEAAQPGVTPEVLDDHKRAVDWYDVERPVLHEVIRSAMDSGIDDPAWQLTWMFGYQLSRNGFWDEQAATYRAGLGAVQRLGDLPAQSRMHRGLAAVARSVGSYYEALEHFDQALAIARALEDPVGEAWVLHGMAVVLQAQHRLPEALEHAQRALGIFRAAGMRAGAAYLLGEVGWTQVLLGQYTEAIASSDEALVVLTELDDKPGLGPLWDTVGYARHHLGEFAEALACYERALVYRREVGERRDQAETLEHLGDTYEAMGNGPAAREHWQEALSILDELGHQDAAAVRTKLGRLRQDQRPGRATAE